MRSAARCSAPTHLEARTMVGLKRLFNLGLIPALQAVQRAVSRLAAEAGRVRSVWSLSVCLSVSLSLSLSLSIHLSVSLLKRTPIALSII